MALTVFLPLFVLTSGQPPAHEAPDALSAAQEILRDDASLNDVAFVDGDAGWAVGNRGTILHTRDGGRTWHLQSSGTEATLEAIHFVDRSVGYAAGGRARPDGAGCYGVLLQTEDGGRRWRTIGGDQTGWLYAVWADRQGRGWVLGEPTAMHSAGLWRFGKEGRRIRPVGDRRVPTLLAACFRRDGRGIAVGLGGACVIVRVGELTPQRRAVSFQGRLAGVAMVGDRRACMVGDDATIFTSPDAGRTWAATRLELPAGLRELIDLTDVAFADERHGWAVGSNGRYVLLTRDGGATWRVAPTGLSATLRSIAALDARTVVAVGERGLIARSEDGGDTWSAVRNGDKRIGALVVSSASAPWVWPMMAHLAGHHRCRTAHLRVTTDGASPGAIRWAANACGVSSVLTLNDFEEPSSGWAGPTMSPSDRRSRPMRSRIGLFRYWSERLDRDAESAMRRQIAAAVRNLKPAIVVIDETDACPGGDLVAESVAWAALEAIDRAGEPRAMQEQSPLGLAPHRVKRVLALAGAASDRRRQNDSTPKIRVGFADTFNPLLGTQSRLAAVRAGGYLGLPPDDGTLTATFRVVRGSVPKDRRAIKLMSGIRLADEARFPFRPVGEGSRVARLKAVSDALVVAGRMGWRRGNPTHLVELAMRASREFPDALAPADALYQAGVQFERMRRHRAAAEVWRAFLNIGRSHPAWTSLVVRQAVVQSSAEHYMSLPIRPKDPLQGARAAVEELGRLCAQRPYMAYQPEVLFAQAHCHRVLGRLAPARQFYRRCAAGKAPGWPTAGAGELWLLDPTDERTKNSPRMLVSATHTAEPITIDGRLDERVWKRQIAPALTDADGRMPEKSIRTRIQLAWDDAYLYLAATVHTTHGRAGPPRGHSLRRDRLDDDWPVVEWTIDVDRDAATYYRLGVDEIANGLDAHNDDLSWSLPTQPTPLAGAWQYLVRHEDDAWHVEMAVPMVSMFPRRPAVGQVWAIQIVRKPAHGETRSALQWLSPQPGPEAAPQHFALLMFSADR